jgi:Dimerisation domain/O-methyltransferase domain
MGQASQTAPPSPLISRTVRALEADMDMNLSPVGIIQLGVGFWVTKTLLSAVEFGVFTALAPDPLDAASLRERLRLHPRSAHDFFDALVALGLLERQDGLYANTPETDWFLDRSKPTYIGGYLEMVNARLYAFWGSLTEALRSGQPQNESKTGDEFFPALYQDPLRLQPFLQAMTGISLGTAQAIAQKFPWGQYRTFVDVGCAQGCGSVHVARAHPHISGGGFDLAVVGPIFEQYVTSFGLESRLQFHPGDFFAVCRSHPGLYAAQGGRTPRTLPCPLARAAAQAHAHFAPARQRRLAGASDPGPGDGLRPLCKSSPLPVGLL